MLTIIIEFPLKSFCLLKFCDYCHVALIDKLIITNVNKELYVVVHSNKKLKRELNFVKSFTKMVMIGII